MYDVFIVYYINVYVTKYIVIQYIKANTWLVEIHKTQHNLKHNHLKSKT